MSRLIDADELLTERRKGKYYHLQNGDIAIPIIDIEHAPTVEPERKKGKWYAIGNTGLASCECGFMTDRYSAYNYCPNCGADMRGEEHETN